MAEVEPTAAPAMTGDELAALSRQYHLLALPLFIMSSSPTDAGIAAVGAATQGHLDYWAKLEEDGVVFAGGPVLPERGSDPWSGDAVIIFKAQSLAAAHTIAEADPMHASGARRYELRPWLLNSLVVPDGANT